ncbi:recombinase family protein [Pseudomonas aeruginosa]
MPSAFSYVRFSSGKQAKGSSEHRQRAMLGQWLEQHPSFTLSDLRFEDLGRSGFSGEHLDHGLGQLLAAIDSGAIKSGDVILVEAVDRIGRLEPLEMLPLFSRIVKAGVSVITLEDGHVYDRSSVNETSLFLLVAKIQQAHEYSNRLSRRINASYTARREKAKAGLGIKRETPVWLTTDGQLVPHVAPHIAQAFQDYADGLGERRICRKLRESGLEEFSKTNATTVRRWLKNRTAIGYWNDIPDVYPHVVDPALFYQVQQRLDAPKVDRAKPSVHYLTGLVKCAVCGRNYNYKQRKHTDPAMLCTSRARLAGEGCSNSKTYPVIVLDQVRKLTSLPFLQHAMESASSQADPSSQRLAVIDGEIGELSRKISEATKALLVLGFTPEIQESLEQLKTAREALEEERATLLLPQAEKLTTAQLEAFSNGLLDDEPMKLNHVLQTAGYSMVVHPDGSIDVDGKRFVYEGASRKEKVYKLRLIGEDKQWSLPILTPQMATYKSLFMAAVRLPGDPSEEELRRFEEAKHSER